MVKNLMMAL